MRLLESSLDLLITPIRDKSRKDMVERTLLKVCPREKNLVLGLGEAEPWSPRFATGVLVAGLINHFEKTIENWRVPLDHRDHHDFICHRRGQSPFGHTRALAVVHSSHGHGSPASVDASSVGSVHTHYSWFDVALHILDVGSIHIDGRRHNCLGASPSAVAGTPRVRLGWIC